MSNRLKAALFLVGIIGIIVVLYKSTDLNKYLKYGLIAVALVVLYFGFFAPSLNGQNGISVLMKGEQPDDRLEKLKAQ